MAQLVECTRECTGGVVCGGRKACLLELQGGWHLGGVQTDGCEDAMMPVPCVGWGRPGGGRLSSTACTFCLCWVACMAWSSQEQGGGVGCVA